MSSSSHRTSKVGYLPVFLLLDRLTLGTDGCNDSPKTAQDFGIEKHGFKLPPPFYPRKSPPAAISTDFSSTNGQALVQEHEYTAGAHIRGITQQSPNKNPIPLRPIAPSFHAHPTPPSDHTGSLTASPSKNHGLAHPISFQPTPPLDTTPSPASPKHHDYNSSQNISFYPQPSSSTDKSPQMQVAYQGYAFGPPQLEYSPHNYEFQASESSPIPCNVYVSPGQHYDPQSPYYGQPPRFPVHGPHPTLTPSATPFEVIPQQWGLFPGHPAPSTANGFIPTVSMPSDTRSHHRSVSQSLLKSDTSAHHDVENDARVASSDDVFEMDLWRAARIDNLHRATQSRSSNSSIHNPLAEHILLNFNNEDYADCKVLLSHEDHRFPQTEWSLSTLILAQSPKLRDMLMTTESYTDGKQLLHLRLTDRFVTPQAMDSALRVFYGESPQNFNGLHGSAQLAITKPEVSASWMANTLAYTAAGCLLRSEIIVLRGLQVASKILDWSNLEVALSFGLESGLGRERNSSAGVVPAYSPHLPRDADISPSSRTLFTPSSGSYSIGRSSSHHSSGPESPPENARPTDPRSAFDLLLHSLGFIKDNMPATWEFDASARPLADVDRLPVTAESRSPLSKSRLSQIQFGDHPSEAIAKSSDLNVLMSSIVLSLPFIWLDMLLKSVRGPITQHIGAIIKERERRRHIVLQSQSVSDTQRFAAKDYEWVEVGHEESVEINDVGEVCLARTYTGISRDPPTPSKAEA